MRFLRPLFFAILCAFMLPGPGLFAPLAGAAIAQQATTFDFAAWEKDAAAAEAVTAAATASNKALEDLRAKMVDWRSKLDAAKTINAAQIDTLKKQIAALGSPAKTDTTEAPETVKRRAELSDTLARAQIPGLAAVEGFSRAESIIGQIDKLIRLRQADALLRLMPSPANPLNWPSGVAVLSQGTKTLWTEAESAWNNPIRRDELGNNLPLVVVSLVLAALLLARGSQFMEWLTLRLQKAAGLRARNAIAALVSLGQIAVPVLGMVFLVVAIINSGMTGPRLEALVRALPFAALAFFLARWLGGWLFASDERTGSLRLTDRPAEARFHVMMIGLIVALETFRTAFTTEVRPPLSQAAQAVWLAPGVCLVAIFLVRLGLLLRRQRNVEATLGSADAQIFRNRMVRLAGTAMVVVGVVAPALALIGYVAAANALVWPTVGSAALIGLIILLLRFLTDIYTVFGRHGDDDSESLLPVLLGFVMAVASLPLFALIWGARTADLSETWTRFKAGVVLGGTRISPTAILTLLLVFSLGYMTTRLLQGAVRTSILPRTKLSKGAQNAAVSGLGYVGLMLAALIAVAAAGIDLSALAIVAGALSVGIGFGLQNIVSNFVAGIILLIERPISEGDMIQVGDQFGTVKGISVRSTWIETFDRTDVIVPNSDLVSGVVTNLTRGNLTGRMIIPVGVGYGSDTRKVQAILQEIAEAQPLIMVAPAPKVYFVAFGADSLNFEIRAILSDVNFKMDVQSEVHHEIADRFAAEGIEIPFAQRDIWLRNPETLLRDRKARQTVVAEAVKPEKPATPRDNSAINNDPTEDEESE
jgi:potassium-dependent mechanosensitive channel